MSSDRIARLVVSILFAGCVLGTTMVDIWSFPFFLLGTIAGGMMALFTFYMD